MFKLKWSAQWGLKQSSADQYKLGSQLSWDTRSSQRSKAVQTRHFSKVRSLWGVRSPSLSWEAKYGQKTKMKWGHQTWIKWGRRTWQETGKTWSQVQCMECNLHIYIYHYITWTCTCCIMLPLVQFYLHIWSYWQNFADSVGLSRWAVEPLSRWAVEPRWSVLQADPSDHTRVLATCAWAAVNRWCFLWTFATRIFVQMSRYKKSIWIPAFFWFLFLKIWRHGISWHVMLRGDLFPVGSGPQSASISSATFSASAFWVLWFLKSACKISPSWFGHHRYLFVVRVMQDRYFAMAWQRGQLGKALFWDEISAFQPRTLLILSRLRMIQPIAMWLGCA